MKIEKHTPTPQFKPISITITIETEEEKEMLLRLTRYNISIPELLYTDMDNVNDYLKRQMVERFLDELNEFIR
jgi:hypothetical protein